MFFGSGGSKYCPLGREVISVPLPRKAVALGFCFLTIHSPLFLRVLGSVRRGNDRGGLSIAVREVSVWTLDVDRQHAWELGP